LLVVAAQDLQQLLTGHLVRIHNLHQHLLQVAAAVLAIPEVAVVQEQQEDLAAGIVGLPPRQRQVTRLFVLPLKEILVALPLEVLLIMAVVVEVVLVAQVATVQDLRVVMAVLAHQTIFLDHL
jgi:hypothetical protein